MAIEAVHQGDRGPRVATLHKGLLYLIRHQFGMEEQTRRAMEAQLKDEVATKSFGAMTAHVVGIFQYQIRNRQDLPADVKKRFAGVPLSRKDDGTGNGDVDDLTAEALNWLVRETRALRASKASLERYWDSRRVRIALAAITLAPQKGVA